MNNLKEKENKHGPCCLVPPRCSGGDCPCHTLPEPIEEKSECCGVELVKSIQDRYLHCLECDTPHFNSKVEGCQWENCSGGKYCKSHSLLTPSTNSKDEEVLEEHLGYCKKCNGCGEVGCDGIESFLNNHVRGKTDCLYEESYIEDIINSYKYLNKHMIQTDEEIKKELHIIAKYLACNEEELCSEVLKLIHNIQAEYKKEILNIVYELGIKVKKDIEKNDSYESLIKLKAYNQALLDFINIINNK